MDMDIDEAVDGEAMDWVETPAYWKGWEASTGRSGSGAPALFVVLDTNVLVEPRSLDSFRRSLAYFGRSGNRSAGWTVAVCVPWTVLSELDGLKQSKLEGKRVQARAAMKYLDEAFTTAGSGVSFFGQSMAEFKEAIRVFGVQGLRHSNDDLILQCTLQKQKMLMDGNRGGDVVVLLTGDRNLCLKSRACGVAACTSLDALDFADLEARRRSNLETALAAGRPPVRAVEPDVRGRDLSAAPRRASGNLDARSVAEISGETLEVLQRCLSLFVRETFQENFGPKEWESMVSVPPPWTIQDLFKLVKQHWFSLDLDRESQSTLDLAEHVHGRRSQDGGKELPRQTFLMFFDNTCKLFENVFNEPSKFDAEKQRMSHLWQRVYGESV